MTKTSNSTFIKSIVNLNQTICLRGVDSPQQTRVCRSRQDNRFSQTVRLDKANIKTFCDAVFFILPQKVFSFAVNSAKEFFMMEFLEFVFRLIVELAIFVGIAAACDAVIESIATPVDKSLK